MKKDREGEMLETLRDLREQSEKSQGRYTLDRLCSEWDIMKAASSKEIKLQA